MAEADGKKEIEAVCDTWNGGLVGYLLSKIGRRMEELNQDDSDGMSSVEMDDLEIVVVDVDTDRDNDNEWIGMDDMDIRDEKDSMDYKGDDRFMAMNDQDITGDGDGIYDF